MRIRSDLSTVRTCDWRAWDASWAASSAACATRRARRMRIACSLFWSWLRSSWQVTTIPLGRWVMRTAESVVLTP